MDFMSLFLSDFKGTRIF